tara:strand:- start:357 stop:554 length:198 start_codon:yes stop_codon:yes gene_type:complete
MESKITENKNPSDKRISVSQINLILKQMVELPYKNSAITIQVLTTLQDVNTSNKVNTNTITKDKA